MTHMSSLAGFSRPYGQGQGRRWGSETRHETASWPATGDACTVARLYCDGHRRCSRGWSLGVSFPIAGGVRL